MRRVFADALYRIAMANPSDQWHEAALVAEAQFAAAQIVTTEEVLTELLAALSGAGEYRRVQTVEMIEAIFADPNIFVLQQSHDTFVAGLDLYRRRPDKRYSLTDCISMNSCRAEGITEVLTNDHHFTHEGFTVLITR